MTHRHFIFPLIVSIVYHYKLAEQSKKVYIALLEKFIDAFEDSIYKITKLVKVIKSYKIKSLYDKVLTSASAPA